MISAFSPAKAADQAAPALDPALLMKVSKTVSGLQNKPDPRCNLLAALKPYLRKERRERVDEAMRLLQLMRLAELFRKENH